MSNVKNHYIESMADLVEGIATACNTESVTQLAPLVREAMSAGIELLRISSPEPGETPGLILAELRKQTALLIELCQYPGDTAAHAARCAGAGVRNSALAKIASTSAEIGLAAISASASSAVGQPVSPRKD